MSALALGPWLIRLGKGGDSGPPGGCSPGSGRKEEAERCRGYKQAGPAEGGGSERLLFRSQLPPEVLPTCTPRKVSPPKMETNAPLLFVVLSVS